MEKTSALISNMYASTQDFLRLQIRSAKLEVYERITNIIASGISAAFILLFSVIAFLFLNLALAFWLSQKIGSYAYGFLSVGGAYVIILGIYLLLRKKIAGNSVKNIVLHKVSKDLNDYDLLLKEQALLHTEIQIAEENLKENYNELKDNLHTLKEDIQNLKGHSHHDEEKHVGAKLPRIAITSAIDFLMQHFLLKKAGLLRKAILPIVANTLVTSKVFKEDKKTSFTENLKLKFAKFL